MRRYVSLPEDDARLILDVLETTAFSGATLPPDAKERHDKATHAIRAALIDPGRVAGARCCGYRDV